MNNNWVQSNNNFFLDEVSQQTDKLPVGVYKVNLNPKTLQLYCSQMQDKFSFPYKVYGVEEKFINRVEKSFQNTTGNLGILMNGVKGTGKTVTSQMICNKLNLPVLIIHEPFDALSSFLNEIQQDIIVFFDEYEKMYKNSDSSVLTIMDGVLNNEYRKVFLLTTNSLYLNDNMLQRPGRLRYVKTFADLTVDIITEVVDDKLVHKQFREATINFIARLDTITIDIVQAVVSEVNIHEESPEAFKDIFNIQAISSKVNLYINDGIGGGLLKLEHQNVYIEPVKFSEDSIDEYFEVDGDEIGLIKQILDEDRIVVELFKEKGEDTHKVETFRIERLDTKHKSFSKWTM